MTRHSESDLRAGLARLADDAPRFDADAAARAAVEGARPPRRWARPLAAACAAVLLVGGVGVAASVWPRPPEASTPAGREAGLTGRVWRLASSVRGGIPPTRVQGPAPTFSIVGDTLRLETGGGRRQVPVRVEAGRVRPELPPGPCSTAAAAACQSPDPVADFFAAAPAFTLRDGWVELSAAGRRLAFVDTGPVPPPKPATSAAGHRWVLTGAPQGVPAVIEGTRPASIAYDGADLLLDTGLNLYRFGARSSGESLEAGEGTTRALTQHGCGGRGLAPRECRAVVDRDEALQRMLFANVVGQRLEGGRWTLQDGWVFTDAGPVGAVAMPSPSAPAIDPALPVLLPTGAPPVASPGGRRSRYVGTVDVPAGGGRWTVPLHPRGVVQAVLVCPGGRRGGQRVAQASVADGERALSCGAQVALGFSAGGGADTLAVRARTAGARLAVFQDLEFDPGPAPAGPPAGWKPPWAHPEAGLPESGVARPSPGSAPAPVRLTVPAGGRVAVAQGGPSTLAFVVGGRLLDAGPVMSSLAPSRGGVADSTLWQSPPMVSGWNVRAFTPAGAEVPAGTPVEVTVVPSGDSAPAWAVGAAPAG